MKSVSEISEYGFPMFHFLRNHVCLRVDGDRVQRQIRYEEIYIIYTYIYTLYIHAHYMRKLGLTTLPPSCADCREIWEPQPPKIFKASPGL